MKKLKEFIYRPCGKITDFVIIAAILSYLLVFLGQAISEIVNSVCGTDEFLISLFKDPDAGRLMFLYLYFGEIWLAFFLVISVFKNNRPMWKCLSFRKGGNSIPALAAGLLLGFGTNTFCILMSILFGDIKLYFNRFDPAMFFSFLVVVLIQSGAEEICDRCYLYQKLRRRYRHPAVAILGNALLFMSMHLANPGIDMLAVVDLILSGVIFSLLVYYYDSLWSAIMFHTSWNFTQNIIFGLPNSGVVSEYSLFRLDAASARNGFFYTVDFGVEGSLGAIVVLAVLMAAILLLNRGRGERRDLWKQMEMESAETVSVKNEGRTI